MLLSQMFPKKTLDAADLAAINPGISIVTIENIDYKVYPARDGGQVQVVYYMKVREFSKPFKLGVLNGRAVGDLMGTEDTDLWIGQTIGLRPYQMRIADQQTGQKKIVWAFDIDMVKPTTPPTLPINQDITGAAAFSQGGGAGRPALGQPTAGQAPGAPPADGVLAKIGVEVAAKIIACFRERGRDATVFASHLDTIGMRDYVAGKEPPDWPALILPVARKFCVSFPKVGPPPTPEVVAAIARSWRPPNEVVDKTTGEVITPATKLAATVPDEIAEEEIPF